MMSESDIPMTVAICSWLALAIIELVGAGTLTLLCSNPRRWGLPARLGLSFGLGQVALTLWLFVASLLGFKPGWCSRSARTDSRT